MEEKFNAICIKTVSYRENDKILTLFTLEGGIIDCIMRGVKKSGAKLKFAAELFCFAEYVTVEKSGRRTVTEVNEIDAFYGIRLDIEKYYAAMAVIEYLRNFCQSGEKSYDLFLKTVTALKAIESSKAPVRLTLVRFFMDGLSLAGYGIDFSHCFRCGKPIKDRAFFDFDDCVFKCSACADLSSTEMRFSTYRFLSELDKVSLSDIKDGIASAFSETLISEACIKNALKFYDFFLRAHLEVTIKSNALLIDGFPGTDVAE